MMNFVPITPELFLLVMTCATLLLSVFARSKSRITFYTTQLSLIVTAALVLRTFFVSDQGMTLLTFNDMFIFDYLAMVLKVFVLAVVFFSLLYSRAYNADRPMSHHEYYILALLSTLGMMLLISAHGLLTMYLGLELFSLPLYAMVAMRRDSFRSVEAGMKYFVISAVGSGLLLYGFSFLFGVTGSLTLTSIAAHVTSAYASHDMLLLTALVFSVAGIAFKLGVVPFQMWVPDVYDGAPTSTTLFVAAAPKLAAFALTFRLLAHAMGALQAEWQVLLMVLSVLSMVVGNFSALVQTNIKRLLAYSSIAHMGYMLLGLVAGTSLGYAAALFYAISYTIMTTGGFGILLLMSRQGIDINELDDLRGLATRSPWLAFIMLLVMFSMAGVPPLLGFIAKVQLLEALVHVHLVWLVVVTLLMSVIGVFYYLRIVQRMYFEEATTDESIQYGVDTGVGITLNGLMILLLGVFPEALYLLATHAISG